MFYQLGKFTIRFRWPIIIFWAILFLLAIPFALRAASHLKSGFGDTDTESRLALDILAQELDATQSTMILVFSSDSLTVDDPRYVAEMQRSISAITEIPEVKDVTAFYNSVSTRMVSDDRRTTFAIVSLDVELDDAMDLFPGLKRKIMESVRGGQGSERVEQHEEANTPVEAVRDPPLQVWATGGIPIFSDLNAASERDLRRGEAISLPLVLVALIVVFGGLVAAGVPVAMGAISVAISLAALYLLAQGMDVSIFALNIVSFLGLGVAVDYSLLVVTRFREELEQRPKDEAVAYTVATAGRALLFSGITSVLGLSSLLLFDFMMLRSIGIGGMLVVAISFVVAITLLPAILSVLGYRVNRLSLVRPRPRAEGHGFWRRLASWVMVHPFMVSIPLMVLLVLLGTPFLDVKIGSPWASILPPKAESRQGWDVLAQEMGPGALTPIVVVARSPHNILAPDTIGSLYDFLRPLQDDPRVDRVESLVTLHPSIGKGDYQALYSSPEMWDSRVKQIVEGFASDDTTVVRIFSRFPPMADETRGLLKDIRSSPVAGNLELYLTGVTADLEDTVALMYGDFPKAVLYVMVTIYLALFVLFRSVVLPLKAAIMNGMSIFASYGALVYIFQQGHFQSLLGFQSEGFTESTVPILLFAIIFGLSMDYEVFLLSRVKEIYDATGDNVLSVTQGLERTGRVITSAALVLVLVAGSFSTGDIVIVKALGVGTAIAIFLDATVVRALLVPALMRILGDWNWWSPGFLRRLLPGWEPPT